MSSKLKELRMKAGLTQTEISDSIGCTMQYYNMIENGKRTPSVGLSKKIAKLLNTDWTIFFNNELNQKFSFEQNYDRVGDQTHSV